ncbi:MAG: helix-turn-helix domain-containing protein [Selenomonas sp.]|jgi:hypothetical protein|nr:helix-turn-helix domain-containing protein [Selenomonas sp.]
MMDSTAMESIIASAIERASRSVAVVRECQTPDELLTVVEVAAVLGVGKNYANMLVQSGIIRGIKLNGMKVRRRELERWMAAMDGMDLEDPRNPVPIGRKEAVA